MAQGTPWTQDEMEACLAHPDYASFASRYPHRTYMAYHVKKCTLKKAQQLGQVPESGVVEVDTAVPEENWEAYFSALEDAETASEFISPTSESVYKFFADDKPVALAFFGDLHAGAAGVDYGRFRADMDTIAGTDGLYAVGMGDYVENTKPGSKSQTALYTARFPSPREQGAYVRLRLARIRGKLIALCGGNHDAFDYRFAGLDRLEDLAAELKTTYFPEKGGTIYLTVGDVRYVIAVKHDYRGKSKVNKSGSARSLWTEWPWAWENADVVCLAHLHEPDLHYTLVKGRHVAWLRSGTYKVHDGWAEAGGYNPSYGVPLVVFFPGSRKILPFPPEQFDEAVDIFRAIRAGY